MGREIRKVPPNWKHPHSEEYPDRLQPMYDENFEAAATAWKAELTKWESGERPDYCTEESRLLEYWEWETRPPERIYYRPWKDEEATWYQLWETVSEGTPVSPPFATKEELVDYLAEHGDDWGINRGTGGWGKERATAFVMGSGWAPSMVMVGGQIMSGVEFVTDPKHK